MGEALRGSDNILVAHREGLHLRVILGKGAEAAIGGTRMAGIADLRKEHGGITGALAHDTVCGSSYGAGLGGIGGAERGAWRIRPASGRCPPKRD